MSDRVPSRVCGLTRRWTNVRARRGGCRPIRVPHHHIHSHYGGRHCESLRQEGAFQEHIDRCPFRHKLGKLALLTVSDRQGRARTVISGAHLWRRVIIHPQYDLLLPLPACHEGRRVLQSVERGQSQAGDRPGRFGSSHKLLALQDCILAAGEGHQGTQGKDQGVGARPGADR